MISLLEQCHTDNLYDCGLLKTGDSVIGCFNGKRGVVEIRVERSPNLPEHKFLEVTWADGTKSTPYPNQVMLMVN
jgi:hypothetical protein